MKKLFCLITIIGLFIVFTAPLAFSQDLDRKWFKMTYSAKGYVEGEESAVGSKASAKLVSYIQFVYNTAWSTTCPAGYTPQFYPFYEIHVWYHTTSGWDLSVWQGISTLAGPKTTYGLYGSPYHETTFLDNQFVWWAGFWNWLAFIQEEGGMIWADATMIIDIKRKNGQIISATFNAVACSTEIEASVGNVWGSCTLKGKLIKPESLPEGLDANGASPQFTNVDDCTAP